MKRLFLTSCIAALVLAPILAQAQSRTPPAGATSVGSAAPRGGESGGASGGGSTATTSGGSGGSGASAGSSGGSGGNNAIGGVRSPGSGSRGIGGTGAGGYSAPRGIDRDNGPRSGETVAIPRSFSSYSSSRSEPRGAIANVGQPVPAQSRPRGDARTVGYAAPRGSTPKPPDGGGGGGGIYEPPYYGYGPWWGGYYPYYGYGYYICDWYWACGSLSPFWYYQWFSPWSMWDDWSQMGYAYGGGSYARADLGGIRFKVIPKQAEIWADGYYEGQVDDYDSGKGLQLPGGMHRIEIKAKGYETLALDLRAMPGKTVTYTGELKPIK